MRSMPTHHGREASTLRNMPPIPKAALCATCLPPYLHTQGVLCASCLPVYPRVYIPGYASLYAQGVYIPGYASLYAPRVRYIPGYASLYALVGVYTRLCLPAYPGLPPCAERPPWALRASQDRDIVAIMPPLSATFSQFYTFWQKGRP